MPDYELFTPDEQTMDDCLTQFQMKSTNSGKVGTTVYAWDYYGTKYTLTGTVFDAETQKNVASWVPLTGFYCNIRWMGASTLTLTQQLNKGANLILQTAPYYRVFA